MKKQKVSGGLMAVFAFEGAKRMGAPTKSKGEVVEFKGPGKLWYCSGLLGSSILALGYLQVKFLKWCS